MWNTPLGILITVIFGLLFSAITGGNKKKIDQSLVLFDLLGFCKFKKNKNSIKIEDNVDINK